MNARRNDPYEFVCPVCGAVAGKRCKAAAGKGGVVMSTWTHRERDVMTKYKQKLHGVPQ